MKYRVLTVVFIIIGLAACKKDNQSPNLEFADIPFTIYDLREIGDTTITEVNYPNTLILKRDYTWTIDLGGAKSNGRYTWTPTSNQQGDIKFTIGYWDNSFSNQNLSAKLRDALLEVNHYGYSLQDPTFINFLHDSWYGDYFPFIRTNKK
jgi:hypothetical protein